MEYYLDLCLRPDPELPANQLRNVLFTKLHLSLVALGKNNIGVSFPDHRGRDLGPCVRLHGAADKLEEVIQLDWLKRLHDHVAVSPISPVPAQAKHRLVQRVQAKSNPERLRRRLIRRHGMSAEKAKSQIPDTAAELLNLPYLQIASGSTQQHFCLFVRHGPIQDAPVPGTFNSYGFGREATVPWF